MHPAQNIFRFANCAFALSARPPREFLAAAPRLSNVPVLGSEQMYQALKRLGRPTELVVYPGEYHEFKTPSHIKDRLERYLAWYAHYVKGDSTPARPAPSPKSAD